VGALFTLLRLASDAVLPTHEPYGGSRRQ
jgi:hypothetical protein